MATTSDLLLNEALGRGFKPTYDVPRGMEAFFLSEDGDSILRYRSRGPLTIPLVQVPEPAKAVPKIISILIQTVAESRVPMLVHSYERAMDRIEESMRGNKSGLRLRYILAGRWGGARRTGVDVVVDESVPETTAIGLPDPEFLGRTAIDEAGRVGFMIYNIPAVIPIKIILS